MALSVSFIDEHGTPLKVFENTNNKAVLVVGNLDHYDGSVYVFDDESDIDLLIAELKNLKSQVYGS